MAYIYQYERAKLLEAIGGMAEKYSIGGRILDVGAGRTLRYKRFFPKASEYKTQDIESSGAQPHDYVGDAKNIPAPNGCFDAIISTQVLEHVPEPWLVVKEMDRLLKPGGYCLLSVPQSNELHEEPHDYFRYTKFGIRFLGKSVGWIEVDLEPLGNYWTARVRESQRFAIDFFNAYEHEFLGKILSVYYKLRYGLADWMDRHMLPGRINEKFVFGWVILFRKAV